jgi:hypothetical protein
MAEKRGRATNINLLQWNTISETGMHNLIEYHINPHIHFTLQGRYQSITSIMIASTIAAKGLTQPNFFNYPLFTHLHVQEHSLSSRKRGGDESEKDFPIQQLLRSYDSVESAANYIQEAVQRKISRMMSIPWNEIEPSKPLQAYSVDSLVAVELQTWVSKVIGAEIAVLDILGRNTIVNFSAKVVLRGRVNYSGAMALN